MHASITLMDEQEDTVSLTDLAPVVDDSDPQPYVKVVFMTLKKRNQDLLLKITKNF